MRCDGGRRGIDRSSGEIDERIVVAEIGADDGRRRREGATEAQTHVTEPLSLLSVDAASAAAVVAAFVSLAHFDAMTTRGAARSCARVVAADL